MTEILLGGGRLDDAHNGFKYVGEVDGANGIKVKLVAFSTNQEGQKIATFELEYPRAIHSEVRTHCMLDMNASSSRAIPMEFMRNHVRENLATPSVLTKNQAGMQGKEVHDGWVSLGVIADVYHQTIKEVEDYFGRYNRDGEPLNIVDGSIQYSDFIEFWSLRSVSADHSILERSGLHKQIVNRFLEPFQFIKTIVTATEWDNFFNLRFHPDADPTLVELANCMAHLYYTCEPEELSWKEWHTPYVSHCRDHEGKMEYWTGHIGQSDFAFHSRDEAIRISCCACAQVSYRKLDTSPEKVQRVYDLLINGGIIHGSAFSHVACPMVPPTEEDGNPDVVINDPLQPWNWQDGVTHVDRHQQLWSSKFKGWIQYRKLIPNESCDSFDYESRKAEVYGTEVGAQLTQFGGGN